MAGPLLSLLFSPPQFQSRQACSFWEQGWLGWRVRFVVASKAAAKLYQAPGIVQVAQ
jgi:hypothetical protein